MAACRWIVNRFMGDCQWAEMLMLLTKCPHWSWRTVVYCPGNCWWGWDQQRFRKHSFNWGFGHGGKIYARAATTLPWGHTGHAAVRKQGSSVSEDCDHWWRVTGVWIWPKNHGPVVTKETSNIPEAQTSTTGSEQCEGDIVFFFEYRGVVYHEYAPLG
jgi:hypothetical protein